MPKKIDSPKISKSPKKPKTAKGYKIPDRLPTGTILTDCFKKQWEINKSIGYGGFGEIYLVTKPDETSNGVSKYVLKLEPYTNGPLFTEINFYKRVGKSDLIKAWMKTKKLNFLGIPQYIGSGSHEFHKEKTRFLVMERFGVDIQKILDERKQLPKRTVLVIAIRLLDVLEYIHSNDFVHSDVKGGNVLLGYGAKRENEIHLLDYGLATKYKTDSGHKEYKEDPRKAHDGTIEYTSIDAHNGVFPSRRSDLQILGYNLLHWLSGTLPWMKNLKDKNYVREQKIKFMEDIPGLMEKCFGKKECHPDIVKYLEIVMDLNYEQKPPYEMLRGIFENSLKSLGLRGTSLSLWADKETKNISNVTDETSEDEMFTSDKKTLKRRISAKDEDSVFPKSNPKSNSASKNVKTKSPRLPRSPSSKRSRITSLTNTPLLDVSRSPSKRTPRSSGIASANGKSSGAIAKTPNSARKQSVIRRRKNVASASVGTQTTPGLKKTRSIPKNKI